MESDFLSTALVKMVSHPHLRRLLAKRVDDYVYKHVVRDDSPLNIGERPIPGNGDL